jgi:N-acetylglucosaminyl-diphospho-decaprenol L-rhamnosyltransferase
MRRIGVVIVAYNSTREIGPCLDSLPPGLEVVVVDNASADDTRSEALRRPNARLIANPWNRGFAGAANQGIQALDCEYVLLINPDIEIISGVESLAAACEASGAAAAGGCLIGEDGAPQAGFMVRRFPTAPALAFEVMGINRVWPGNPVNRRYRCLDLDAAAPANVEQPPGALLMIRREAWRQLGGFDESFHPVWFEDVDFLKRAAAAGYKVRYLPSALAKHKGGHSVSQVPAEARQLIWYGNLLRYVAKHFTRKSRLAVCSTLMAGSIFRAASGCVRTASFKPVAIYARVFRLAGKYFFSPPAETPILFSASAAREDGAAR